MPYDEALATRFRTALADTQNVTEKRMMGGVCFMVNGNMVGGAHREKSGEGVFMFRVGKENEPEALGRPGARPMINGTRRMRGFVFVDDEECGSEALDEWIVLALSFVTSLPAKT